MGMLIEHTFFSDLRLPHTNHKHLHLNIFKFKEEAPTHCTFTNFKTLVCIFKYYDCFMETYLIYYEYFLKIIVYVYMWYLGHIIGKQQILICSKVVVKSNCTVYSVQWLNTWVTHTHNTHTGWHTDTLRLSLWHTSNKLISQYLIQDSTFGKSKYHWFTIFQEDIWSPVYCAMYMTSLLNEKVTTNLYESSHSIQS